MTVDQCECVTATALCATDSKVQWRCISAGQSVGQLKGESLFLNGEHPLTVAGDFILVFWSRDFDR